MHMRVYCMFFLNNKNKTIVRTSTINFIIFWHRLRVSFLGPKTDFFLPKQATDEVSTCYYHIIVLVSYYGGAFEHPKGNKWMNKERRVLSVPSLSTKASHSHHLTSVAFTSIFSLVFSCFILLTFSLFFLFSFKFNFDVYIFLPPTFFPFYVKLVFSLSSSLGPKIISGIFCTNLV